MRIKWSAPYPKKSDLWERFLMMIGVVDYFDVDEIITKKIQNSH